MTPWNRKRRRGLSVPCDRREADSIQECRGQVRGHWTAPKWGDEMDDLPKTQAYLDERERLSPELRGEFDTLVKWYRYYAMVHHKQPFTSYKILAALIRDGWRLTVPPPEGTQ